MTFIGWVRWLHENEDGFLSWLLPLALGFLGFTGQQQAASTQREALEGTKEQIAMQKELQDYMLGKRRGLYDPIEKDVLLPRLTARATSAPAWAPQAGFWARQLGSKMSFPTK